MRKIFAFFVVTADGYYEGPDGEFDWPNVDQEFKAFILSAMAGSSDRRAQNPPRTDPYQDLQIGQRTALLPAGRGLRPGLQDP
ncbi:hypothetical protein [Acrocarpospora catenulata]|uniref:hypothetical protein n=1 Tax=Acrocarpospora catenulata TaxID=2836182 RepID=UPI001BD923AC|nr:hypothetical protein [Acrocarpospora catenulata]